eukprot:164927-Amorphochlora_amoeboformis.AAC.2
MCRATSRKKSVQRRGRGSTSCQMTAHEDSIWRASSDFDEVLLYSPSVLHIDCIQDPKLEKIPDISPAKEFREVEVKVWRLERREHESEIGKEKR